MATQEAIDNFVQKCRTLGLSVTPQRLSIFKALVDDHTHPRPEDIYKKIKTEHPTISLATIYKTLETFEKHGIISVVTHLHNTVRYDPITEPHHHVVCVKCNKIIDVMDPSLNELKIPEHILQGNELLDYSIHFNVICSECRVKETN